MKVHGKDAVLTYDSDEESIADTTSPANTAASMSSPVASGNGGEPNHNNNNNNNSSHMSQQQPPPPLQHHSSSSLAPVPTGASLTGLSSHFNGAHGAGQYHHHYNQMSHHQSSLDFKPQYLADWYSHGMTSIGGVSRYDPASVASSKPVHHVTAALPTPPSTGHSPIQSLSNHLHLLPSTTTAYT